jgi:hypothetical protein
LPLSLGYAFRSSLETVEVYYGSLLDALPLLLGIASLLLVAGVLVKSAATRTRLREAVGTVWPRFRTPSSLPEIAQETPPGLL